MQKTKIEWADMVWNPIKGLCPVDCKLPDGRSYCYARKMYLNPRYNWSPDIKLAPWEFDPSLKTYRKCYWVRPKWPKKPKKVFVCSTFELFHPCTEPFRDIIFDAIRSFPQHTFIILTKLPQNIDREMPDNVWLGVSVTQKKELWETYSLPGINANLKFISFEPNLGDFRGLDLEIALKGVDWIIVGRLTKCGKGYDPSILQIQKFVNIARHFEIPIFLKNNLKDIWKGPLIQEFPE